MQADVEVPARITRVPLQHVEQDESKGRRSFLGCWLTAVNEHCCPAPHKGFLHPKEGSPPSLRISPNKGCGVCGLATDVRPLTTSICAAEKEPQGWGVLKHQLPPQEGRDPVTDPVTPLASSALERHLLCRTFAPRKTINKAQLSKSLGMLQGAASHQLNCICSKSPDAIRELLHGHLVLVVVPAECLLIQVHLLKITRLSCAGEVEKETDQDGSEYHSTDQNPRLSTLQKKGSQNKPPGADSPSLTLSVGVNLTCSLLSSARSLGEMVR
ncbi:hypothetical protein EK904_007853 [Melospiza melodia maxima]|nr:hypothetical protein EK904_007853 [Melospiza melodia maxima]